MEQQKREAVEALRTRLKEAVAEPDVALRLIRTVAVLTKSLGLVGIRPVLVGGGAVEFYTAADYQTGDIDLMAPSTPDAIEVMTSLGFQRRGKDFHHPGLDVYVEFPGSYLQPGERSVTIHVDGEPVLVVSPEDLLLDRMRAFVHWRSLRDGVNILSLLRAGHPIDLSRVSELALAEGLASAWEGLMALAGRMGAAPESSDLEASLKEILRAGRD